MRLLLFSDLHADTAAAHRLVQQSAGAEIAIGAGDFGNMHRDINRSISVLQNLNIPTVLVPGNNESFEELEHACSGWKQAQVLHGSSTVLEGITFFGIGGGIPPTPFGDWSYDFTESAAAKFLQHCPENAVIVSHSPPYGVLDLASNGSHLGSRTLMQAIKEKSPRLVVCGHVHACGGRKAYLGKIPIINAGPEGIMFNLAA